MSDDHPKSSWLDYKNSIKRSSKSNLFIDENEKTKVSVSALQPKDTNKTNNNSWLNYKNSIKKLYSADVVEERTHHPIKVSKPPKAFVIHESKKYQIKLDLHGQTENMAYEMLEKTFRSSLKNRIQNLLIITGKGYRKADFSTESKGILRSSFERWMKYSSLSMFVEEFSIAKVNDGGDGAFYVKLKNIKSNFLNHNKNKKF